MADLIELPGIVWVCGNGHYWHMRAGACLMVEITHNERLIIEWQFGESHELL